MAVKKKKKEDKTKIVKMPLETDLLEKGATPDGKITSKWFLMALRKS